MEKTTTHQMVERNYADLLKKTRDQLSCCEQRGAPEGYQDIERLGEAAETSFGCGNPLAFAGVETGQTVLDLGSGAGLDLLIAAEKVGPQGRVIGIDMTDEMIATARRNAERAGHDNIELRKGMIEDLPVEDASIDWVISNCVINLSPDKPRVFTEIARVLKPGGQISISDIVVETMPDWLRDNEDLYIACVAGAIPEGEYLAGLQRAGLTDVVVKERQVYTVEQMLGIVREDLAGLNLSEEDLRGVLPQFEGQVWSAKFSGRKPLSD